MGCEWLAHPQLLLQGSRGCEGAGGQSAPSPCPGSLSVRKRAVIPAHPAPACLGKPLFGSQERPEVAQHQLHRAGNLVLGDPPAPHPAPSSSSSRAQALGTCPCYLPFPKTPPCCFGKQRDGQKGDHVPACRLAVPLSPPGALFWGFQQCWQGTSCESHPLIRVPSSHFHSNLELSRFSPTWKVSRWATRVRKA